MKHKLRASIDIGSNSILLLVAEFDNGSIIELLKKSEVTQLGKDLDKNGFFHPESMLATQKALEVFTSDCRGLGIGAEDIIVTATEASRVSSNAKDFFSNIKKQLGLSVAIISSEGEAYYSAKGILYNTNFEDRTIVVMDIGGASTELIKINTESCQILESVSMPIGSVRSNYWLENNIFVPSLNKIFNDFRSSLDKFQNKKIFCVAGTATSLGNMHLNRKDFIENDVHGLNLKIEDIDTLFKQFADSSSNDLLEKFPFLQQRALSIRGGLHLMYHLAHRLMIKQVTVSTYGLRYGTLLEGSIKQTFIQEKI